MASKPIRDPAKDELLTAQNSALIVIDYQPAQVNSIGSMDRQLLVNHIVGTAKAALAYGLPIVHSTVNVKSGFNKPPVPQLRKVLDKFPTYDRTTINAWEDLEFRKAVEATGRKKLIMAALWTEQAGAKLISVTQLFCELQRDWRRRETVPAFINLFIETGGTAGLELASVVSKD
jgi:nicotinamidase-related amidase